MLTGMQVLVYLPQTPLQLSQSRDWPEGWRRWCRIRSTFLSSLPPVCQLGEANVTLEQQVG